jgi:hypothetical protein
VSSLLATLQDAAVHRLISKWRGFDVEYTSALDEPRKCTENGMRELYGGYGKRWSSISTSIRMSQSGIASLEGKRSEVAAENGKKYLKESTSSDSAFL